MTERLSAPPLTDQRLTEAGFSKGGARAVKAAAREYPGVPVPADGLQVSWTPRHGYDADR